MAGRTQDRLWETFAEVSAGKAASLEDVLDTTAHLASSLGGGAGESGEPSAPGASAETTGTTGLYEGSANPVGANVQGSPLGSSGTNDGGSSVGSIASTFFESGFGMAALVKGLMGLFDSGSSTPPPLEKYEMPAAIDFESAVSATGMSAADYDQTGTPRATGLASSTGSGASAASPQVTVNVQAMDSQSFLDHSDAIAQAVRGAMLSMSSINDVVNEL